MRSASRRISEVGRPPLRTVLAPNIKTANEGYVSLLDLYKSSVTDNEKSTGTSNLAAHSIRS